MGQNLIQNLTDMDNRGYIVVVLMESDGSSGEKGQCFLEEETFLLEGLEG